MIQLNFPKFFRTASYEQVHTKLSYVILETAQVLKICSYMIEYKGKVHQFLPDLMASSASFSHAHEKNKIILVFYFFIFSLSRNGCFGRKLDLIVLLERDKIVFFSQVPSRPPERIIAESHVTLKTIPVTWQPMDSSYIHGILLGYKIRYQAVAIGEEPVEDQLIREEIVSPSTFFLVLRNLEIFTLYRIDVMGYTIMGNGPPATDYAGLFNNIQAHHTIMLSQQQVFINGLGKRVYIIVAAQLSSCYNSLGRLQLFCLSYSHAISCVWQIVQQ